MPRGHRHLRVVIAGCLAVDEISERISPVRFDQSEIRVDRFFQNVKTPVEFAGLLAGADWILLFLSMVLLILSNIYLFSWYFQINKIFKYFHYIISL